MSNVETWPTCPKCGMNLDYEEQISTDYDDIYYFVNWSAFCPNCQRSYHFSETFKLVERRFLDEEN